MLVITRRWRQLSSNAAEPALPTQIVDMVPGREALMVVEHQLPEMEIQQQIMDSNEISWIPWRNILSQSKIDNFEQFMYMNIGLRIANSESQNQQLQRWWGNYPPLVEHFNKLVQQIRDGDTIVASSDGSYLEDGWALANFFFMRQS